MRIVVPATAADNVAARCLRAEGMEPEVRVLRGDHDYAALIAELWSDGETFAVVEDDIAPWPGALASLRDCERVWCGFDYCLPGRWDTDGLYGTTGCYKVDARLIAAAPDLPGRWEAHDWRYLDCAVMAALRHITGLDGYPMEHRFHVHGPPVAHAMHYRHHQEVIHG